MASTYQIIEDAIFNAISVFNKEFYPIPIATAKAYNVTPCTIQQRVKKVDSQNSQIPSNCAFNLE